jgi:hypothetical protein
MADGGQATPPCAPAEAPRAPSRRASSDDPRRRSRLRSTLVARGTAGGWSFGVAPDGTLEATKIGVGVLSSGSTLVAGSWQHVAVTFAPEGTSFYVDGQLVVTDSSLAGTADIPYTPLSLGEPLLLGARAYSGTVSAFTGYLEGSLDEVTVYGRVLAPDEIASIAAAAGAGKCRSAGRPAVGLAQAAQGPSARTGYAAVFTRAENAVFVVGA